MTKAGGGKTPVHVSIDMDVLKQIVERRHGKSVSSMINDVLRQHFALPRYKHLKRGTTYSVLGRFEVQASTPIIEGQWVVAYQCDNGSKWTRSEAEFFDGRFVRLDVAK